MPAPWPTRPFRIPPGGRLRCRWLLEGLLAAALGFGALAALFLLLWTLSPYPAGDGQGALRLTAGLWLLAHGAELLREGTLGAGPAPIGLSPLLLCALPGLLLYRAVRAVDWGTGPADATRAALWISGGYLLGGTAALLFALPSPLAPRPLSAALHLPLFALAVTLTTTWIGCGPPLSAARLGVPRSLAAAFDRRRTLAALRVTAAGAAGYCAAGAVLATAALALRAGAAQDAFGQLSGDWTGRLVILLLTLALAPNAAVWAAAYGLGPGFATGTGSAVGPLAVTGEPALPLFPLLAALPAGPPEPAALWAVAAAPAAGAIAAAATAAQAAVPVRGERVSASGWQGTAITVLLGALGAGLALGLLAALAGGPLGTGTLASFGPDPLLTGAAAAAWTAVGATPLALIARAWRLRGPRAAARATAPPAPPATPRPRRRRRLPWRRAKPDPWHATLARSTRWAALKRTSGALVPDITEPVRPDRAHDPRPPDEA